MPSLIHKSLSAGKPRESDDVRWAKLIVILEVITLVAFILGFVVF